MNIKTNEISVNANVVGLGKSWKIENLKKSAKNKRNKKASVRFDKYEKNHRGGHLDSTRSRKAREKSIRRRHRKHIPIIEL